MKIIEATAREVMTKREQALKRKLIALLRDDGKGHKHAKYAERLEDFIVKIVDRTEDPDMTAAISFEDATIYISDGFLDDPQTFYQLNVLMRHELAHYLMQHQLRMMHKLIEKYGKEGYTRIKMSLSIHKLLNIIEDFEISNKRYSEADKVVVKNMSLNGQVIGGLVTENIRSGWKDLSVIDMFEELTKEIYHLQQSILARWNSLDLAEIGEEGDWLHQATKGRVYSYVEIDRPTNFFGPIEDFIKNKALYHFAAFDRKTAIGIMPCIVKFSSLEKVHQDLIVELYELIKAGDPDTGLPYTRGRVKEFITQIAKSNPLEIHAIVHPETLEVLAKVYTPEEKLIAIDVFKAMLSTLELYQTWYEKVTNVLGDSGKYSAQDIQSVLDAIDN